jgi:rod shape-determining protein MreD
MIRDLVLLVFAFLLVAAQAALGTVLDLGVVMPNVLLPVVIYLGMAPDISLQRGAILSFIMGLLLDSACGNAMGLQTFVHEATFLVARAASFRLLMRGRLSQVAITALTAFVGSVTLVALRAIFRPPFSFNAISTRHLLVALLAPALATGALAPFIFQFVRRIDGLRRREESAAVT